MSEMYRILVFSVAFVIAITIYGHYNLNIKNLYSLSNILSKQSIVSNNTTVIELSSSVWCSNTVDGKLICAFKNLCYVPLENQFVFFLSKNSVISGIENKEQFQKISLSSVDNHNLFNIKIALVAQQNTLLSRKLVMTGPILLLWRFKIDNIMHVLHDDIIPLYFTYMHICAGDLEGCVKKYTLAFADDGHVSPLHKWYEIFSSRTPLYLPQEDASSLICFSETRTGLSRISTWFQYGFSRPQGPLKTPYFNRNLLHSFTEFVLQKLKIPLLNCTDNTKTVLLLNRKINRKILNENHVLSIINSKVYTVFPSYKLNIITLDLATDDVHSILSFMLRANIVIGMHGSLMILSLFLRPGSAVVEMFPFGINPNHVSFLKAFCEILGEELYYTFWVNTFENNTVPNPSAPPLLGGINHLSNTEQAIILETKKVPAVECCHNPMYLFRMFQDTIVAEDFASVLEEVLLKHKHFSLRENNIRSDDISQWYFPAPVSNIRCDLSHETLKVSWMPPINAACVSPFYEIAITLNKATPIFYTSKEPNISVTNFSYVNHDSIQIWVKYVCETVESPDVYKEC